jgi:hypothetical protein
VTGDVPRFLGCGHQMQGRTKVRAPDVRGCRSDGDETEPLENRPAVVGGVDLEVAIASLLGEARPVRDQRAVDPAAAPGLERRTAPERREVGVGRKPHPGGRDHQVAGLSDDDDERIRVDLSLGLEEVRQDEVLLLPDGAVQGGDPVQIDTAVDLPQRYTLGHLRLGGDGGHRGDHHRLGVLRHEPCCSKPVREIGRQIVPVQLPLESLSGLGEGAYLTRNQLVERRPLQPVKVAVVDEPAHPQAAEAQERPVSLDPNAPRQAVGQAATQLLVVQGEKLLDIGPRHVPSLGGPLCVKLGVGTAAPAAAELPVAVAVLHRVVQGKGCMKLALDVRREPPGRE